MIKSLGNLSNKQVRFNPLIGKQTCSLFLWFLESYYPDRVTVYAKKFTEWQNVINKRSTCRGKRETLYFCKLVRLSVTRYLSGEPLPIETPNIKLTSEGLPLILLPFHGAIRVKEIDDLRIIFTMLNLTRGVILDPIEDFKSITDTWKGSLPITWDTFKTAIKKTIGFKRARYSFGRLHTSTKSGPNGQAMLFSTKDYQVLPDELKNSLRKLGGPPVQNIFDCLDKDWDGISTLSHFETLIDLKKEEPLKVRKLSLFGDKEGKTRVIGILDYWSQTVLRPIHKVLENTLRRIPEDCTFDQSAWYTKLPTECTYYSFDLTNATDRLPVKHQKEIISIIFGKRIADAWEDIMVHYSFTYKKTQIHYGSGQPMGAYSSWPIMALQHHIIINHAALLAGKTAKGKYVLLGDDVVIADDQIAEKYKQLLSDLDVPISMIKTHISKEICEFAKRWYFRGSEITAFPLHSMKNNLKRYYLLQNTIEDSRKKGYILSEKFERGCMIKLIQLTGKKQQASRIYKLYKLFDAITMKNGDYTEYLSNINKIILANWCIPQENIDKYFKDPEVFRESVEFQMEEYILDLTSEGNNEAIEMMDMIKKWERKCKLLHPDLWSTITQCIPIVASFKHCWAERTAILEKYYKEFANDKQKLRASLLVLGSLPTTSIHIVNTRSAHSILAAQSRLVKMLLEFFCKIRKPESEMTEDDWISQMKTLHSSDGNDAE